MSPSRYLVTILGSLAAVLLGIAAFNYLVDPYLVFDRTRRVGFNQAKPAADNREWTMKAYEALRHNPRTVVLGSSRSDIGLNPDSPSWPHPWQPVYNLSMAGTDLSLNLHYLKHLLRSQGDRSALQTVVVGLDFESFLERPRHDPRPVDPRERETVARLDALAATSMTGRLRVWQDHAESLATLDALVDSLAAVRANRASSPGADIAANGQYSDGQLQQWTRTDGVAQLFKQKNQETLRGFKPPRRRLNPGDGSLMNGQAGVAELLDLAKQRRLKLVLLIQPSHVSRLEMLAAMGYWGDFERWKQVLTNLTDAARVKGVDVTLWDFSGYETENLEPMPSKGQAREPLQWYWDPVHYRPSLGDRMLAAITAGDAGHPAGPLTLARVEARLQQVRTDQAAYRARDRAEVSRLRALVCPGPSCVPTAAR